MPEKVEVYQGHQLRKTKRRHSKEEGPPIKSIWGLFDLCDFLRDTVKHKQ